MRLRVQYTAQLRTAAGRDEEEVDLPDGGTLLDLLVRLASSRGEAAPHLVTEAGGARPSLLVVVNGAAVPAREASTSVLKPGDVVALLPPIAGG